MGLRSCRDATGSESYPTKSLDPSALNAKAVGKGILARGSGPVLELLTPLRGRQRQGTPIQACNCHFGRVPWKCGADAAFFRILKRKRRPRRTPKRHPRIVGK